MALGQDGDFSHKDLLARINTELGNDLGNLLNRTSSMARRWFAEAVPPAGAGGQLDHPLAQAAQHAQSTALAALEQLDFRAAAEATLQLAIAANGYLAERFLYGSSYPFIGVKIYNDWFKTLAIKPELLEGIYYKNAARFLGL